MTKDEAITAMKEGKKVTHRYFTPDEWVTMKDGVILAEDGCRLPINQFWSYRTDESFNKDWSIWQQ